MYAIHENQYQPAVGFIQYSDFDAGLCFSTSFSGALSPINFKEGYQTLI